jgi:uncharacterized SAM-binding protein YcdF (DUF218 family)
MMPSKSNKLQRRLLKVFAGLLAALMLAGLAAWMFPEEVLTVDSGPAKADVLVVVGGRPDRAGRAVELFKEGEAPQILVSGYGDTVSNEHLLERDGVPAANIVLEAKSHTTRQNAKFSIPLLRQMGAHRVIIVTSWYHSRRALVCFEHYAPDIKFYSRPSYFGYPRADWRPKGISGYIKSEYVKLLGYWVCYGICPL